MYDCPELCCVYCENDDISFSGLLPKIRFERTGTLGNGSPYCDFHFLKSEVKPMIKNYLPHQLFRWQQAAVHHAGQQVGCDFLSGH